MESEPRNLISDLYHRALARPVQERSAFLKDACAGDEALRREVESLLSYDDAASGFLERPAGIVADMVPQVHGTIMLNRQLGPYRIVAPLGSGGMGEVYRARDGKLGRDVAIKILPSHFTSDPERRARFAREARALATLNHPHIGAIYGLEEADGVTGLVLELVEGPTLADRLERGPLPIAEALTVARQIADALDAAHQKGIVHRDLKPANIVLQSSSSSSDARAKVLDFGLAKIAAAAEPGQGAETPASATGDGRILGTPAYMSPEQARGEAVDKRTDIWAFGCVVFEMLSGHPGAFEGRTVTDTLARVIEHDPDWTKLPTSMPASILTLLQRCLRKDYRKRLHDIGDAGIELDEVDRLSSSPVALSGPGGSRRTHEVVAWLTAIALGAATFALAVLYVRLGSSTKEVIEATVVPPDGWSFGGQSVSIPDFAVSPDGRQLVATAATSRGVTMLWVLPTNGVTWRQVGGTEGANSPFWSPDSQSVAYFAGGELKVVRVSGGLPRVLCKTCATNATSGTWSRDDVILFGNASALIKVSSRDGHTAPAITLQKDETAHLWPSFLPDGQRFLYLAQRPGVNELRVGSLTSAETVSLGRFESSAIHADGYLLFVRNGILMAQLFDTAALRLEGEARALADRTAVVAPFQRGLFAASAGVLAYSQVGRIPSQLTWMDRDGKALATVGDPGTYGNLDLSPDGRQLAVSQLTQQPEGPNVDIWLVDLDRAGTASRLTSDPAREFDPAWSTDGTEIAFNSDRYKGKFSLFRRRLGDGEDELLVRTQTAITAPDWSPSDRSLIYSEIHEETRGDLWILPPSGERKPRAFLRERFEEGNATFSPNGQWIAYHSDESGRREVHVRAYPGPGARYPISRDGGRAARWRGDGKELFFLAPDGTLMAAEIKASKDFQAGVPRQLFKTSLISTSTNNPYAVSSDGKRFLVQVPLDSTGSAPITVVLNWSSKLRGN